MSIAEKISGLTPYGTPPLIAQVGLLDAHRIAAHLGHEPGQIRWEIRVEASLESSNTTLMQGIRGQPQTPGSTIFPVPILLAVEEQTAGRGRQGRTWQSAPGASLTFSVAWPMRRALTQLSGLSLSCGLAVRAALLRHGVAVQLKWPNDILFEQRKLAGILVEVQEIKQGVMIVIGVGINITPDACGHDAIKGLKATDLMTAGIPLGMTHPVDRNRLLANLAQALAEHLGRFEQYGFALEADTWNAAHAYQDHAVQLIEQDQLIEQGIARGVDHDGRLLLETSTGLRHIIAGDVSLRPV